MIINLLIIYVQNNNQEKCVDSGWGAGLYYVCGPDGKWNMPTSCVSECEDNTCAEFGNTRSCDIEGDHLCLDDGDVNVSLLCQNSHWIVTPCMGECVDNECVGIDGGCEDDDTMCLFVESLNLSFEMECVDAQWISRPCANGVSCDGEQCEPAPYIRCSEPNGQTCSGKNSWAVARCKDGQCIPEKCKDTYFLSNGDCFNLSECCGDECVNCTSIGQTCDSSGNCVNPGDCTTPNALCNGVCINATTSLDYCGADQNCEHYQSCASDMHCGYDDDLAGYGCICDGKTRCGDVCYELASTLEHCGTCETDCTQLEGWKSGECLQGICQASECVEPFRLTTVTIDGNEVKTCVSEIKVECGEDKVDCAGTIEGWVTGHCDTVEVSGEQQEICVIDTCQEGYHIYDNTCEPDGADHCGSHDTTCTTSDIPGSSDVSCEMGICLVVSCDETHLLSGNSCLARDCQEEQTQCVNDIATFIGSIRKCKDNMWVEENVCADDVSCKDTDACGECRNGQKQCRDNNFEICRTGVWSLDTECTPTIEGAIATCDPETGCGNQCPADKTTVCADACVDTQTNTSHCGGCDRPCQVENADNQCSNSQCTYTCYNGFTDNGKRCCQDVSHGMIAYDNSDDCHFTCDSDYIIYGDGCIEKNCTEGNTKCVNNNNVGEIQKCENNAWTKIDTCQMNYSCNNDETACSSVCMNTTRKCSDNGDGRADSIQTCTNGDWGSASDCTTAVSNAFGACQDETSCGKYKCMSGYRDTGTMCVPDDVYCAANDAERCVIRSGKAGKMQKCVNNQWTDQGDCMNDYSCNTAANSCGECVNDSTKCMNNGVSADSTQTCINGAWGPVNNCTTSVSNALGACSGASACGGYKCRSNYTDNGSECVLTSNYCSVNNEERCVTKSGVAGKMQKCVNNQWTDQSDCSNGFSCNAAGTSCGVCADNSTRCNDKTTTDTLQTCSNGAWGAEGNCTTSVSNAYAACTNDASCGSYKCLSGYTNTGSSCVPTSNYCSTLNAEKCVTKSGVAGKMQKCVDYQWTDQSDCSNGYSCNSAGSACGECANGAYSCSTVSNSNDTVKVCSSGAWGSSNSCSTSVSNAWGACSSSSSNCGSFKCKSGYTLTAGNTCVLTSDYCSTLNAEKCVTKSGVAGKMQKCVNYQWTDQSDCSGGKSCNSAGTACGECANGAYSCSTVSNSNDTVKVCSSGAWGSSNSCSTSVSNAWGACSSSSSNCGTFKCKSNYTLTAGNTCVLTTNYCSSLNAERCVTKSGVAGKMQKCVNYQWTDQSDCSGGKSCNSAGSACGSCANGAYSCSTVSNNNDTVKVCSSGAWGSSNSCSTSVSNAWGACSSSSSNCGTFKCKSNYTLTAGNTCVLTSNYCSSLNAERCVTKSGVAGKMQKCVNYQWTDQSDCSGGKSCNSAGTACGSCANGAYSCSTVSNSNDTVKVCSSGAWGSSSSCSTSVSNAWGACSSSSSNCGTFKCKSNYTLTTGNTCVLTSYYCSTLNAERCVTKSGSAGKMQKCVNYQWTDLSDCSGGKSCNSDGTACGECVNGSYQCSNTNPPYPMTCDAGSWHQCGGPFTPPAHSTPVCTNCGSTFVCDDGYNKSGSTCVQDANYCETNGSTRCTDNPGKIQQCVRHLWEDQSSCGGVSCNAAGTACGICLNGNVQSGCTNSGNIGKINKCVNGAYTEVSCSNNYSCNSSGTGCGDCQNGKTSCSNNSSGIGQLRTCTNGYWGSAVSCTSNYSCNGSSCGECRNGSTMCKYCGSSGGFVHTCTSGSYRSCQRDPSNSYQCPSSQNCYQGGSTCGP